jgi:formylmethanofuran dehydrogenase subunit E
MTGTVKEVASMAGKEAAQHDLKRCIDFHGHLCPGLSLGLQASRALLHYLGEERAQDEELVAVVETDACGSDAIQVMTGCTFGKGNFFFKNFGKHAFTLGSRKSGRAVRVCLRPGAWIPGTEDADLARKVGSGSASVEEKERFAHLQENAAKRILSLEPEALFKIEEIPMLLPPKAKVMRSGICEGCGEPVKADFLENVGGKMLCASCRGEMRWK